MLLEPNTIFSVGLASHLKCMNFLCGPLDKDEKPDEGCSKRLVSSLPFAANAKWTGFILTMGY